MTVEQITVDIVIRYGEAEIARRVASNVDSNQLWTWLFADTITAVAQARDELYDIVERDRQAVLDAESRGGADVGKASDAEESAARMPADPGTPPRSLVGGAW